MTRPPAAAGGRSAPRPRGRRPAGEDTRGNIVAAAGSEFAAHGYAGASLRGIARRAGVDPALLHHYWDGKAELFAETMQVHGVSPSALIARVVDGPRDRVGERAARSFLSMWDRPEQRPRFVAMLRSAVTDDESARALREFLASEIFGPIVLALDDGEPSMEPVDRRVRGGLAASQLLGMALMRYVIQLPEVADSEPEDLVRHLAPTMQRYLAP